MRESRGRMGSRRYPRLAKCGGQPSKDSVLVDHHDINPRGHKLPNTAINDSQSHKLVSICKTAHSHLEVHLRRGVIALCTDLKRPSAGGGC